jgi:hypothetical protein
MGPGSEFPRINARPHFASRANEHQAIDELAYEPYRTGDVPLTPAKRKEYHSQADERWDRIRTQGQELIKAHNQSRLETEKKLTAKFEDRASALKAIIRRYQDGDFSPEQVEAVLADEESLYAPELRSAVYAFAGLEETALPDDTDPEAHFAAAEEERYRIFPALRSRKRETEVEW